MSDPFEKFIQELDLNDLPAPAVTKTDDVESSDSNHKDVKTDFTVDTEQSNQATQNGSTYQDDTGFDYDYGLGHENEDFRNMSILLMSVATSAAKEKKFSYYDIDLSPDNQIIFLKYKVGLDLNANPTKEKTLAALKELEHNYAVYKSAGDRYDSNSRVTYALIALIAFYALEKYYISRQDLYNYLSIESMELITLERTVYEVLPRLLNFILGIENDSGDDSVESF